MEWLTILFIIGITAEGMTGALAAGRERMDLFGVVMIANVTAIGGGSIRDTLLGHYPLSWVGHPYYLLIVSLAAIITVQIAPLMRYFRTAFLVLDALGLAVFAVFGARVALSEGHGIIIAVTAAVITGVAGGIMRDLLCNRVPLVFRQELYASIAMAAGLAYAGLIAAEVNETLAVIITLAFGFGVRLLAIYFKWSLPVFDYQEIEHRPRGHHHPWGRRNRKLVPDMLEDEIEELEVKVEELEERLEKDERDGSIRGN